MRTRTPAGLASLLALVLTLLLPAPAAAKSYVAERFDVTAHVLPDRSLLVEERVVFRFEDGEFTKAFREIPVRRSDGLTDIVASLDGRMLPTGEGPGTVAIRHGREVRITWQFAPTQGTHAFGLRYRLAGVVTGHPAGDTLEWHLLPSDHDYRIEAATVTVVLPEGARLLGTPRVRPDAASLQVEGGRVVVRAEDIRKDRSFRLELEMAPGLLAASTPLWQSASNRKAERGPWLLLAAAGVWVAAFGWLATFLSPWRRPAAGGVTAVHDPPDASLPVALAHRLGGSATTAALGAHATLLDLAARGVVQLEERPRTSRFSSREFTVRLLQDRPPAGPHEAALLEMLFGSGPARRRDAPLSTLRRALTRSKNPFATALESEMRQAGLLDADRAAARRTLARAAGAMAVLGLMAAVPAAFLAESFGAWVILLPASVLTVAAAFAIAASSFSVLTTEGDRIARRWRAFFAHLRQIAKDKQGPTHATHAAWLPWATAAGIGGAWARHVAERSGGRAVPAWFRAAAVDGDAQAAFVSLAAMHSASTDGGSVAATSAGSAAGGGSSGAS